MQVFRAVLLLLGSVLTAAQTPTFGTQYTGDGTYYGDQSGSGHCSFQFSNSFSLAWTTGVYTGVAVNEPQYGTSAPCGMCIAFWGTGPGSGANPISTAVQYAIATDECPECLTGALDLAQDGDGRWTIDWYPVQCNVGTSFFEYSFQGSNAEYVKMAITNTRVPASAVSIEVGGVYQAMTKTVDNYWLADSSTYTFPTSVQVTSVLGDTVTDIVNVASPSGAVVGTAQFPLSSSYDVVGGASTTTSPATTSPASSPEASPEAATSPTPTAEATAAATTSPIVAATTSPTVAATTSPTAEASPTPTPTAESVSPIPMLTAESASPTSESVSPTTTSSPDSPSTASSNASSPAAPYASATTNYSVNASAPAPPIPPSAETSPSPATVPAGTQQASTVVANVSSPAVHATAPTVAVTSQINGEASVSGTVSSPSVNSSSSAVTATSTPDGDTGLVSTPANCTLSVAALQQCGGRGGVCSNQAANSSQCKDAEWDNACCTSGYYCKRSQQWSWTCQRTETNTTQTVGGVVADYHQCGGLGNCAESLCADTEWAGYSCYSGFTCLRWDAFYWQCRDIPFAQAA
ncbi:TPA: hypothetical protein ACH3X3_014579 [Trebouxia sp. C0006]